MLVVLSIAALLAMAYRYGCRIGHEPLLCPAEHARDHHRRHRNKD